VKIANEKITVLANNWDRFGGRALDILNGYALSTKLDCSFAFYWPDDERFPEMQDQVNFFSQAFIDKYRIFSCPPTEKIYSINFNVFELSEAKRFISEFEEPQFFKISDFFMLPKFLDEDENLARERYAEVAESVVSDSVLHLWKKLSASYMGNEAVHGRYGDLIDGSFNQYVDTGKYIDTFSLKKLVTKLLKDKKRVTILSDTPLIVEALEKTLSTRLMPEETSTSESKNLTSFELQTIELLILASSKNIYAPSSSAFSILGSRLGNVPIKLIREETSEILFFRPWARRRWRFYDEFDQSIRNKVRSRDILSLLQHYWKFIGFDRIKSLIHEANEFDSEYVLSLCCEAIIAKSERDSTRAFTLIEKAEFYARSRLHIHHDPLFLSLLVKFCFAKEDEDKASEEIREEILRLHPYQFSKQKALKFIVEHIDSEVNISSGKKTSTRAIWNEVVKNGEDEILFALLKFSQTKNQLRK